MSEHESDQPQPENPPPPPPSEETTDSGGGDEPPRPTTRRLLRSREDRVLGGVAGGLGKYFNLDPVFFRVGIVALAFVGGLGVLLYLAALLFVPSEDPSGGEPPRRGRVLTIVGAILLVCLGGALLSDGGWWSGGFFFGPLGLLIVLGAAVWWLVWGRSGARDDHPRRMLTRVALVLLILAGSGVLFAASFWTAGVGGGVAVAGLVIAIGALLVVAAVRGGARWLIVPALAIAAGLGIVAAADVDLRGGHGERTYAPRSLVELRDGYDLGAGRLEIDLREVELTAGDHELDVELGLGEVVLTVPENVCVVADADVGAGYLRMLDWDHGGLNVGWEERAGTPTVPTLLLNAHVGMGTLQIVHDPLDAKWDDDRWEGRDWHHLNRDDDPSLGRSAACENVVG
jgi:phage shock protein PspC (stress-responsive transcriptional regulator)